VGGTVDADGRIQPAELVSGDPEQVGVVIYLQATFDVVCDVTQPDLQRFHGS
jgi:hypothetical protein